MSFILKIKNPGLESPEILLQVLESPGILKSEKRDCKNDVVRDYHLIGMTNYLLCKLSFKRCRKCSFKL